MRAESHAPDQSSWALVTGEGDNVPIAYLNPYLLILVL
jgi:hypothetical protein